MANPLPCDICQSEEAAQMLTNLTTGDTVTIGPACTVQFFGHSILAAIGSDPHRGVPTKCQACRRTHERMTTPAAPAEVEPALVTAGETDQIETSQAVDQA